MVEPTLARGGARVGGAVGRYTLLAEIASGGMARVWLAHAHGAAGFHRLVAVKQMHRHHAEDADFVAMFLDEARLAARIRHPNVVATLDLDDDADGPYLVMDYVEGDTLAGLLKAASGAAAPLPPAVAVRIALDVLAGLQAAHDLTDDFGQPLRLVHRDVSPQNVLVGVDGTARITDFGVALVQQRMATSRDGDIKGKLQYMAPEQTAGVDVDGRADLFAAGVVLWESLAGRRLFPGGTDGEILRRLLIEPIPRLRSARPELPPALDDVCALALARDPAQRYASAAQFAEALEAAAGAVGVASSRTVSLHVQRLAGPKMAAMQACIRAAAPEPRAASGPHLRAIVARSSRDAAAPPLASEPPRAAVLPRGDTRRTRVAPWAVAVAVALVAVVGGVVTVRGDRLRPPPPAAAAAPADSAALPAQPVPPLAAALPLAAAPVVPVARVGTPAPTVSSIAAEIPPSAPPAPRRAHTRSRSRGTQPTSTTEPAPPPRPARFDPEAL